MTGTVPRSFIVPTILSPWARACAQALVFRQQEVPEPERGGELSKRRWRRRRSLSCEDVAAQRPAVSWLAQAGALEFRVAVVPLVQGELARRGVHLSDSRKAWMRPRLPQRIPRRLVARRAAAPAGRRPRAVASKMPPLAARKSSKNRWKEARRSSRNSSSTSLAQYRRPTPGSRPRAGAGPGRRRAVLREAAAGAGPGAGRRSGPPRTWG